MSILVEMYSGILQKTDAINANIEKDRRRIADIMSEHENGIPERIDNLEKQLEKIDDYMLKIEAFRILAEKHIESKNVLTIEAPPGYRVNLNRLRQWAMLIDPMSSDDPYAQRVYIVAMCDLCFLSKKKTEFTERIAQLKQDQNIWLGEEVRRLEADVEKNQAEMRALLSGEEAHRFADDVKFANTQYWYEAAPNSFSNARSLCAQIAPGAYAVPLDIPDDCRSDFKSMLGKFYDETGSRVLMPVELATNKEFAMSVLCAPGKSKLLDRALQNLLLNIIEKYPAGQNKIYVLDGVRFNSSVLGSLRQLEDSFAIAPVPRTPEQLSATLEQIVSSFSDIDDIIDMSDSVIEYNGSQPDEKKIQRTTIVLFGWPNSFEGQDKEYLNRIMTNYERYGISFISISYRNKQTVENEKNGLPEYAAINAIRIQMAQKETTIQIGENPIQHFVWYTMSENLSAFYAEGLRDVKIAKKTVSSVYPERYDCVSVPTYVRSYKKLQLPFGIDGKGHEHSASFENENFAAYLVGASRSGKSTLLHTLIAGIIRNYHPDNVELWLADFKQLEFKKYIEHCPPHIKYILLDESSELVYDLIDKLTDKMMERQRLFARLGKERIDQLDPERLDTPIPLIFVILDEFSIMSQSIAESEVYRLKLQNLLAKGAALGIRFLFSSQTFTTGIAGLTPTARAQIQQRIAMKGTKEEISETLELSANLKTDQVRNWMDALPPHYALVKYRISADTLPQVIRVLVMYFPDYALRDDMIDRINQIMTPVETYQVNSINTYVAKHPVLVDGNSYEAYSQPMLDEQLPIALKKQNAYGDEIALSLGTPRLMTRVRPVLLSRETRENALLIGRGTEQMCVASVLTSMMRGFLAREKPVQIWAYGKNSLYQMCRNQVWDRDLFRTVAYHEGIDDVCDAIKALTEKIRNKEANDELIILIGIDRICMDFEFVDQDAVSGGTHRLNSGDSLQRIVQDQERDLAKKGAVASTDEEKERAVKAQKWIMERGKLVSRLKAEGKSQEEIKAELKEAMDRFFKSPAQSDSGKEASAGQPIPPPKTEEQKSKKPETTRGGAYNAQDDFIYVIKQGSRLGYHFAAVFSNYSDIKLAGLKTDWFRHRLSFQISKDDSVELFGKRIASSLPAHICQYSNSLESFSFRPYLHPGISWDGWEVNEKGEMVSPF